MVNSSILIIVLGFTLPIAIVIAGFIYLRGTPPLFVFGLQRLRQDSRHGPSLENRRRRPHPHSGPRPHPPGITLPVAPPVAHFELQVLPATSAAMSSSVLADVLDIAHANASGSNLTTTTENAKELDGAEQEMGSGNMAGKWAIGEAA